MFTNYLKTALRFLKRNKLFAGIENWHQKVIWQFRKINCLFFFENQF